MTAKPGPDTAAPDGLSLRRWSRRKLEAAREAQPSAPAAAVPATTPIEPPAGTPPVAGAATPAAQLPPIESLTLESDFTAYFQPQVDDVLKRAALKQLFRDPRFNIMDGLDIYVGDYTQSDPIPDHILKQLVQARAIFNPPKTMLTPEGYVVDVPPEDAPATPEAEPPAALPDPAGVTRTAIDHASTAIAADETPAVPPTDRKPDPAANRS